MPGGPDVVGIISPEIPFVYKHRQAAVIFAKAIAAFSKTREHD